MMSISTEAAEARASLSDERELLRTFEVNDYLDLVLEDSGQSRGSQEKICIPYVFGCEVEVPGKVLV